MSIYHRPDAAGRYRWYGHAFVAGRHRHKKLGVVTAPRKTPPVEAQVAYAAWYATLDGAAVENATLQQCIEAYKANVQVTKSAKTQDNENQFYKAILKEHGQLRLNAIDKAWVQARIAAWITAKRSPRTINLYTTYLKQLFKYAVERKWMTANPATGIAPRPRASRTKHYLTRDEFDALYAAANEHLKPVLLVGVHTGLRPAELRRLRWDDIDLDQRRLVVQSRSEDEHTKTRRISVVPLATPVVDCLSKLPRREDGFVFSNPDKIGGNPSGRIGEFKMSLKLARRRAWQSAVEHIRKKRYGRLGKEAGQKEAEKACTLFQRDGKPWTPSPYTLRHTAATWLLLANKPPAKVALMLGHTSLDMLMGHYGHLVSDDLAELVA